MKRFPVAFVVASILFFLSASLSISMATEEAAVYIVYAECPEGVKPEAFYIRTLAAVLGRYDLLRCCSEKRAKDAVIHHYTHAARGFAAKLTAQQVEELRSEFQFLRSSYDFWYLQFDLILDVSLLIPSHAIQICLFNRISTITFI
ncbi:hypothetical protein B296_00043592 [Ensete ventricosum]|uniref:Inhibitor I9 domain-containing protein n=1 Tax=Ensete ventricosum TaxID=4639 RepID=A0A426Y2X9_ENSVE|nr:hypothetical protein B296_00043592 [Ensete ventricosum]